MIKHHWTHDGHPGEEEGIITFAVMEGVLTIGYPKATLFPIFNLVHPVVETTCDGGFPTVIGFVEKLGTNRRV